MGSNTTSRRTLIVHALATVLVIATVVVFTTRRHQSDFWRRTNDPSSTWGGERTTIYRNLILDWAWHCCGARNVMAPMRVYSTEALEGTPPMDAILRRLRSDGHFNDGDAIVCLQAFPPPPGHDTRPLYSVLVRHGARRSGTYAVRIPEAPSESGRAVSAQ